MLVLLYCAIVGIPDSIFSVKIDSNELVYQLKKEIKAKTAAKVQCDASHLRLFLAKKEGAWLPDDDDLDKLIQTERFLDEIEEMRASWRLGEPSLFDSGLFLEYDVVHVLVVLPSTLPGPRSEPFTADNVTPTLPVVELS